MEYNYTAAAPSIFWFERNKILEDIVVGCISSMDSSLPSSLLPKMSRKFGGLGRRVILLGRVRPFTTGCGYARGVAST